MPSDKKTHRTYVRCPACKKGKIVVATELHSDVPLRNQIIGPGGRNQYYYRVASIHCAKCRVKFESVPGKPRLANQLAAKREREREEGFPRLNAEQSKVFKEIRAKVKRELAKK